MVLDGCVPISAAAAVTYTGGFVCNPQRRRPAVSCGIAFREAESAGPHFGVEMWYVEEHSVVVTAFRPSSIPPASLARIPQDYPPLPHLETPAEMTSERK